MATTTPSHRYLKPEDVRRLKNYDVAARLMVEGWLAGRHRSKQRGSSMEFHEFRSYSPGDDLKLVDWRVYARTDRHYLRTFEQETNMELHLILDSSGSMGYPENGPLTKLEYASFFAACLAYLVVRQSDRVSLHLFDQGIRAAYPPGSTRRHLYRLLDALEHNQPGKETSLAATLETAAPTLTRRGTLVILSDFFEDPARIFQALNPYLHRGFRVHLFHVTAPGEWDLEQAGLVRLVDMETGEKLTLHTETVRQSYRDAVRERVGRLRALAARRQVDYFVARTDQSYFTLLDRLILPSWK